MSEQRPFSILSGHAAVFLVLPTVLIAVLATSGAVLWGIDRSVLRILRILVQVVSVSVLLLGFHYRTALTLRWRTALQALGLAVIVVFGLLCAWDAYRNIVQPRPHEFYYWWIYGRAAVERLNPYEPEHLRQVARALNASEGFLQQLHLVQLPPLLLLFLPLGWFDIQTALLLWYVVHSIALLLSILLLWRIFLNDSGLMGLVLAAALTVALSATRATYWFAQLSFLALLMVLLFWRDHARQRGGIWLVLGIVVKPVLVFFPMFSLLRRHWQTIVGAVLALTVLLLLTIAVFGPGMLLGYITTNATVQDNPSVMYTVSGNQSLLATILRSTEYDFTGRSPLFQPMFIVLALLLTAITGWLVLRMPGPYVKWALALTLSYALLVFPMTQPHYGVLLLPIMLWIWVRRREFLGGVWGAVTFIALEYGLTGSGHNGTFVANALVWLALVVFGVKVLIRSQST